MICKNCNCEFPIKNIINGILVNLQRRKFCLKCSPFGNHNTLSHLKPKNESDGKEEHHKKCAKCQETKSTSEFYNKKRKNAKYFSYCKKCTNILTVERYRTNKLKAVVYKGGKCTTCGYNKCIDCLDFHHIDPLQKDFSISNHKGMSFDTIKSELDKCVLLCRNCHGELHYNKKESQQ